MEGSGMTDTEIRVGASELADGHNHCIGESHEHR
jgi:hypothetical protein